MIKYYDSDLLCKQIYCKRRVEAICVLKIFLVITIIDFCDIMNSSNFTILVK